MVELDLIVNNIKGRKLVIWGDSKDSSVIRLVEEIKKIPQLYLGDDLYKVDDTDINYRNFLNNRSNEYYVLVIKNYSKDIYHFLHENNYSEITDFLCIKHMPVIIQQTNNYIDQYGNRIIGNFSGGEIIFNGYNSIVKIGNNLKFSGRIYIDNNVELTIGNNVYVNNGYWKLKDSNTTYVGDNVLLGKSGEFYNQEFSTLKIGANSTFGDRYYFSVDLYTECVIGEDCQVSRESVFRTNDGHSIFDMKTGENINSTVEISKKKKIVINNHVWVGQRVTCLYNTEIGEGSIVGTNAVVKGNFGKGVMVAGIPAKQIKENIAWSREKCAESFE